MSDYKELIDRLRVLSEAEDCGDCPCQADCDSANAEAADAIEQLAKERDAAVEDLKVNSNCANCKYLNGEWRCVANWCYNGEAWEWRGAK